MTSSRSETDCVAALISDAGGELIGRTRLHKIAVLLELAGEGDGFCFEYRHYGPFSESLASATADAVALEKISETERTASWGGRYSVFKSNGSMGDISLGRRKIIRETIGVDAVVLELAATAAFLASEGQLNPWIETSRLKSDKAQEGRLERAKELYKSLKELQTRTPLPAI